MPAIRIGYLIVPEHLVDAFGTAIRITGHVPLSTVQAALADFIGEGHYGGHVRRMRALYAERRALLQKALDDELAPWLEAAPGEGGLQLSAFLANGADDAAMARAAAEADIHVSPLSLYRLESGRPGLYMATPRCPRRRSARRQPTSLGVLAKAGCPGASDGIPMRLYQMQ